MIFGRGVGLSKKEAKLQAAKQTIETLIPELNGKAEEICGINIKKASNPEALMDSNNVGFFLLLQRLPMYISSNDGEIN